MLSKNDEEYVSPRKAPAVRIGLSEEFTRDGGYHLARVCPAFPTGVPAGEEGGDCGSQHSLSAPWEESCQNGKGSEPSAMLFVTA